jgi:CBS domain containing-hemolysin-like protein
MSIPLGIVLVIVFIFLQGFFAASEMSLVSQNRLRLHHLAARKDRKARMILDLLQSPERFLATTLVGQNIALITSSTLANLLLYRIYYVTTEGSVRMEGYIPVVSTVLVFPLIMVFGQIVPMSISRLNSYRLATFFVLPLKAADLMLFPLVVVFSRIAGGIARIFGGSSRPRNPFVSREELRLLFRGEDQHTALDKEGRKMIHEIFDLQNTFAEDIMTPLIDVAAAPENSTVDELLDLIMETGYSHIPIYRGRIDEIIGVVHAYELIDIVDGSTRIASFIREPFIVPETKPAFDILMEFRQNNKHLAFAVDEYGGVTGLLTMEDIIEEIVGEISDEHDLHEEHKVSVGKDITVIDGTLTIDEFNETFGSHIPREDVETVGGFITASVGRIPRRGEVLKLGAFQFEILRATDRKVERVAIKPLTTIPASDKEVED